MIQKKRPQPNLPPPQTPSIQPSCTFFVHLVEHEFPGEGSGLGGRGKLPHGAEERLGHCNTAKNPGKGWLQWENVSRKLGAKSEITQ